MSLFFRGFHPQGTSGAFVAAATAGRMLNLDAGQMQHTLGIVGSQAGGLMAAQEGAMVKRFHCGPRGAKRRLLGAARQARLHRHHRRARGAVRRLSEFAIRTSPIRSA